VADRRRRERKIKKTKAIPAPQVAAGKAVRRQSVNIKELAAHLGVSQTTVSRVMNDSAAKYRIAEDTQQRVLEAAASLNYEPNAFARGLRKKRSFTVGVMVSEISEGYAATVLGGIGDSLLEEKFFYFVVSHRHRAELLQSYPRLLLSRGVEGIIAVDTPIREQLPVPVVAVSGHSRTNGIVTIELDHETAARYALSHLLDLGHRRIAFIKGQTFSADTKARWEGIRKVCSALGICIYPELLVQLQGIQGSEPGYLATKRLLKQGGQFSALFAFNDISAIGAISALHEAGISVPAEVSVIGFDDISSASTNNPALTTVRQPLYEMGRTAATTLLRQIREGVDDSQPESILVSPCLIKRGSTQRAPLKLHGAT
jgi:DNA-binding LacI/PurR family transcriptional regulator